jgi:chromosome segregation ATPase
MKAAYVVGMLASLLLAGCTITERREDITKMEQNIPLQEQYVLGLQQQNAALEAETKSLLAKLANQDVTITELSHGLDELIRQNGKLRVATEAAKRRQQRVESDLRGFQNQLSALRDKPQEGDKQASEDAKRKRIEELKREIQKYLKLLELS